MRKHSEINAVAAGDKVEKETMEELKREIRQRLNATPQLADARTQSRGRDARKRMPAVVKLKKIPVPDNNRQMRRNSSQPYVAINHYYKQNHAAGTAHKSARCSPNMSASRGGKESDSSHLRNPKQNLSRDRCLPSNAEVHKLLREMLKPDRSLHESKRKLSVCRDLISDSKLNTSSGRRASRAEPPASSRDSSTGKPRLQKRRESDNAEARKQQLPRKLLDAVLNRTQKGQINVSINQNVNNVCYGPVVYVSKDPATKEAKTNTGPEEEEAVQEKKGAGRRQLPPKEELKEIVEEVCEFKGIDAEEPQHIPGPKVTIRLLDSLSKSRDRIISHNISYVQKNGSIPPTSMEYYKFVKLIGKGSFGKVMLGIHKLTGKYVAIKAIDKSIMKNAFSRNKVLQEVYILKKIRHANVIRLLEVFEDPLQLLIVMEYAAGGDLLRLLKKKGKLSEEDARGIFRQVVYGLGHIHSRYVLHRDIKLDNILLDSDGGVKICDFGVSKIYTKGNFIKERCGTPAYIAPEVISNEGYEGYYIDHWSLGIVLYAMLCAAVPFKADNMEELLDAIKSTPVTFPVPLSDAAKDLILNLLRVDPYERLSIPEILDHPWMRTADELKEDDASRLRYKDCVHLQAKKDVPDMNIVNVANLFFSETSAEETLSYTDYCYINNDLYTQHVDDEALKVCESYGFPKELVLNCLQNGILNHATAAYNLLVLP